MAGIFALGASGAQAAPPGPAGLQGKAPTAALLGAGKALHGPKGRTVVRVLFKPGVKVASAAAAVPQAVGARSFTPKPYMVAPLARGASYTVDTSSASAFIRTMKARPDVADATLETFATVHAVPNDPEYNTASTTGDQAVYMPAIGAPTAWDYGHGSSAVKIAVIDTGADLAHPDLVGKTDPADVKNTFNSATPTNVTDVIGHGTFVAGTAAATTNNGIGIAGAGYDTHLIVVKASDDAAGDLPTLAIIDGINFAISRGAKIINMSLGSPTFDQGFADAVKAAQDAGILVIASAGNDAQAGNAKSYPAAYPNVIAVGATDAKGHRAWFSENGSWVTMAAPGIDIRGTTATAGSNLWPAGLYGNGDGTSFSSPLVAGAAALVWARSPQLTAAQVRSALVSTAHGYAGLGLGTGQLDMGAAMKVFPPSGSAGPDPTVSAPAASDVVTGPVPFTATASAFNGNIGVKIGWFVDGTRVGLVDSGATYTWQPQGYAEGSHTVEARLCTVGGSCSSSGTSVAVTLNLPAPTITSPAAASNVLGYGTVTVTNPAGGGVAILDNGTRVAFDATAPEVNFTGGATTHSLTAVICNTAGTLCHGNTSPAVSVTSSSVGVTRGTVTNPAFSPNADKVKDTVTVAYTTTSAQTVRVRIRNSAGTDVKVVTVGSKAAGTFTFVWDGKNTAGAVVPAGTYRIRIETAGGSTRGLAVATVQVDTAAPVVSLPAGTATAFYPVVDTYRDTFVPRFSVNEAATVTLVVKNSAGTTVRSLSQSRTAGAAGTLAWNGKNAAGVLQPAGTYKWNLVAVDPSGRRTVTAAKAVSLLRTKLTNRTSTFTKTGQSAWAVNAGPACAQVTDVGSSFTTGLWLKNNCATNVVGTSAAYFHVTVPAAVKYVSFTFKTTGRSHSAPADVLAGLFSSETADYDFGGVTVPLGATTTRTLTLTTIKTGGHVPSTHVLDMAVFVPNDFGPLTDWDISTVSVTVNYQVLA